MYLLQSVTYDEQTDYTSQSLGNLPKGDYIVISSIRTVNPSYTYPRTFEVKLEFATNEAFGIIYETSMYTFDSITIPLHIESGKTNFKIFVAGNIATIRTSVMRLK